MSRVAVVGAAAALELAGPGGLSDPQDAELVVELAELEGPWPVARAVFALPPPQPGAGALIAGGLAAEREEIAAGLRANGQRARTAYQLTLAGLRAAAVVVLPAAGDVLPARAMSVLGARRVLVAGPCSRTFGLRPGIEFLHAAGAAEAVERAEGALVHPESTAALRAVGAVAARFHAADDAWERLRFDVSLRSG